MSEINIKIKLSNNTVHEIKINNEDKISQLKQVLVEKTEIPADLQKLIYAGKVLKDDDTISSSKLAEGHTIHLVKGSKPKGILFYFDFIAPGETIPPTSNATQNNTGSTPGNTPAFDPNMMNFGGAGRFGNAGGMGNIDPNMMNAMLSDPAMMQTMSQMFSNPETVRGIINSNPALQNMGINPELMSSLFSNPAMLQTMMNPAMLQQMNNANLGSGGAPNLNDMMNNPMVQQYMQNMGQNQGSNPTTPGGGMNPALAQMLQNMGQQNAAPADTRPPEERFQSQLSQLADMGFVDATKNVRALLATNGNVQAAIEYLFNN